MDCKMLMPKTHSYCDVYGGSHNNVTCVHSDRCREEQTSSGSKLAFSSGNDGADGIGAEVLSYTYDAPSSVSSVGY